MSKGLLIVLSGPSGVGKGTINAQVRSMMPSLQKSISVTTRSSRPNETNGVHYHFITQKRFEELVKENGLLEYAQVYQNYYGTPKKPVMEALDKGIDIILEIDIQGARQIKQAYNECVRIFITPPSIAELKNRLEIRGTESNEARNIRFAESTKEIQEAILYDYLIINDDVLTAAKSVTAIINAEKCKTSRNEDIINSLIKGDKNI